jgi:hypothetical protein
MTQYDTNRTFAPIIDETSRQVMRKGWKCRKVKEFQAVKKRRYDHACFSTETQRMGGRDNASKP